jgi:hypothetical protein
MWSDTSSKFDNICGSNTSARFKYPSGDVIAKASAWFPTTLIKIGHKKDVIDILIKITYVFIVHAPGMSRIMMAILPLQLHCSFP